MMQYSAIFKTRPNVTADYLLGLSDYPEKPVILSQTEQDLIAKLRVLTGADRQVVTKLVEFLEERETR